MNYSTLGPLCPPPLPVLSCLLQHGVVCFDTVGRIRTVSRLAAEKTLYTHPLRSLLCLALTQWGLEGSLRLPGQGGSTTKWLPFCPKEAALPTRGEKLYNARAGSTWLQCTFVPKAIYCLFVLSMI